jgi:hypothetical protein
MARTIRPSREITGVEPKDGYEWDAGYVPDPASYYRARVTVRKEAKRWEVISVVYFGAKKMLPQEITIAAFDCETCAKAFALNLIFGRDYAACAEHSNEFISEDSLVAGTVSLLMSILGSSEPTVLDRETIDAIVSVAQKILSQQIDWHSVVDIWEQLIDVRMVRSFNEAVKVWYSLMRKL